jgi:HlyD family secretion protein
MPTEIYRKVSLERLASPEELDYLLHVTSPREWVALIALGLTLAAGVAWGFRGTSTATSAGQGVIVRRGGVQNVVSMAAGQVSEVRVAVGDLVQPGQVVALVAQPAALEKLRGAQEYLAAANESKARMAQARELSDKARLAALDRQQAALNQEIAGAEDQIRIVREQIPVDENLAAQGLVTKQTAIQTRQRAASLAENVTRLRAQLAQLESDRAAVRAEDSRADLDNRTRTEDLLRNVREGRKELEFASRAVAANAGRVVEVKVYPGAIVSAGAPILAVEPLSTDLEVVAYLPSAQVKEIAPGMRVDISPSGVQREEYGYLLGKVKSVGEFPATSEAVVRTFENEALARALLGEGPVTEVRIGLTADKATRSGYRWSSPKGPPSAVSSGSVCSLQVVTREQPPIELVIPYVKKKLGL